MFQWLRKMFGKTPVTQLALPPRRELVQWFPACNMWVPMSIQFWIDKGYSRKIARELYEEGVSFAHELMVTGVPRDGNGMYGYKGKDHGTAKPRTDHIDETRSESDADAFLLAQSISAGSALCSDHESSAGGHADTDGFTGLGGSFGGGGADAAWDASGVSSHATEVAAPAPDVSSSYDAGSSISDTSSSFDSSGNC